MSCQTSQFAAEVRDLLLKSPTEQPYDQLKEQLTKRTTASEQRKLQLLFTSEELGDRKPTQLLRRMQQLLGDRPGLTDTSGTFPSEVAKQSTHCSSLNSRHHIPAEMEDKVMEVAASPIAGIQAGTTPTSNMPPPSTTATDLSKQVDDLRSRLEKLFTKLSRSRSSSSSRSRSSRQPPICNRLALLVPPHIR